VEEQKHEIIQRSMEVQHQRLMPVSYLHRKLRSGGSEFKTNLGKKLHKAPTQ
jgi:hypothetical protein